MNNWLYGVSIALILTVIAFAIFFHLGRPTNMEIQEILGLTQSDPLPVDEKYVPIRKQDAIDPDINAEIALVIEADTGRVLYEKNSPKLWPPASLNQLMTALVVVNTLSLPQVVTIEEQDTAVVQPKMGLFEGEQITIHNLLRGLLIPSANDAGATLARVVTGSESRFVELMNQMAVRLGMRNTTYRNTTGFDVEGQLTTAEDLAILVREVLKNPNLAEIVSTESTTVLSENEGGSHRLVSSNQLLKQDNIHGVKTGYTDEAKGNLILLASNSDNHRIITIVLGSDDREVTSQALVTWVFESFEF